MPGRVLIVEDDANIRSVLDVAFTLEGYEVRTSEDGERGLLVAREWRPQVILLDLMLPVLDGAGMLRERRRLGLAGQSKVVIVSASRAAEAVGTQDEDVVAVITKPFDLDRLLKLVQDLTSQTSEARQATGVE